ncbi:SusC/RagA family TonB-linked outer membrane protein [Riemerella columbina]|uniref:SusC/RagA family TonB-linked outer membrane protein n=1 Tax=Riemerella columbina TaxID=103810 RepID=UPI000369D547|nr:SusC/RagA family TonB-linked outer membrane protein [Riemerella columbina]
MNVKLQVLTAGAVFFMGAQGVMAQKTKNDTVKTREIEEVVMVGFGQKKAVKELTGSVGKIGKDIADSNSGSIDKAMAGKVAGVQMGMSTGQPGGAANIRIRGMASINGRNNPIIIIDGVRVAQGDLTINSTTSNILANLNDADIESVTVLKDAVSTAVYGADAGAGVVIITTKSGKRGAARFNLTSETGVAYRAINGHEGLSTSEMQTLLSHGIANRYRMSVEEARKAAENGKLGGSLKNIFNSTVSTNWRNETERTGGALLQKNNLSVSGGNDRLTYYTSLGYFNQDGVTKGSSFQRISGTTRVNFKATDKLTLSTDIQTSYGKTKTLSQGGTFANPILGQYFLRPTDPVRNADGSYYLGGANGKMSNNLFNVAALQDLNYKNAGTARVFANLQAEYKIAKNLTYRFVFAPELINIEEDSYASPLHGDGYNLGGAMYSYATRYFNFNVQNILSYDLKFGDRNNFSASLIQEAYREDRRLVGGEANVVGSPNLQTLDNFIIPRAAVGSKRIISRGGYAATVHYDYDKLFLLDLSGRQDRVSNFWDDNKSGYFWSAGVGVDLARLESIKNVESISQLKFSASYGTVGNLPSVDVSPFYTYFYGANYGDKAGAYPIGVDNRDLKWETLKPLNIGFDLGLFRNRLTLGFAYYNKVTSDMIFDIPLSMSQGGYNVISGNAYASKYVNVGSMRNSGLEFTLGAQIIKSKDLKWSLNANFSTLDNKVLTLAEGKDVISGSRILREGETANAFYLRKWAGVDSSNGKPLWYKNGIDGETTSNYNEAKQEVQGSPYAKIFGGVDTQFSYKNFDIEAQFSYGFGNKIYDSWAIYLFSDGQYTATYPGYKAQLDFWTPDNRDALNPAPIYGNGNNNANAASTRFLYKGDYVRLRTLKLAYNFDKNFLGINGVSGVQLYVLGNNLWTHTFDKNLNFDPDLQLGGNANLTLPPMKSYSLGVNFNF